MLTIVTTTKDRPLCFSILEGWIKRQTVKPDQWLVVTDSDKPEAYSYTMGQEVIYRDPKRHCRRDPITNRFVKGEPRASLLENWLTALPRIKGEKVLVIEDDDYYHPTYLEVLSGLLDNHELAGFKEDVYFKLRTRRFQRMHNMNHASLAATGFRRELLSQIRRCCELLCPVNKSVFIDMYLWAECQDTLREPPCKCVLIPNKAADGRAYHVAMKQMPGAFGLGNGHGFDGSTDPNLSVLQQWIGVEDCRVYRNLRPSAWSEAK
jgi:hypothetical protein